MANEQYVSEIKIFGFGFPPRGWAFCNGQILQISTNQALFSLLGTTYGGNGTQTFALPNLQGRSAIHAGTYFGGGNYQLGQAAGEEAHTLSVQEIPAHLHTVIASTTAPTDTYPANTNLWAKGSSHAGFSPTPNNVMNPVAIALAGGNQGHENRSPYLVLNFCIALQGVFPSRN